MIFNFPSATYIDNELLFQSGKFCALPHEYLKKSNKEKISKFYQELIIKLKGCETVQTGTDPLGFDYIILDFICYVGLIFIGEKSSKKNSNKKKYPNNKFPKEYIKGRINEEYDQLNINKYVPVEIFSQSLHELRGLNSKISGHIDNLMQLTDENLWAERFDEANENFKKIYVGSRMTKFILDNVRFFNPQFIEKLTIDKQFRFVAHKSIYKIVKIYQNDFTSNKAEITFTGNSYKYVRGEREYFEILIKTLIENALKFSTEKRIGPKINIEEMANNKLKITISSYGRLIPKEEKEDIFTRGYRSTVHSHTKGTGMGLYIAYNLAKLYNISLYYKAEEVSEDKSIKIGWNKFILICNETENK